jgi:hypothetical protein
MSCKRHNHYNNYSITAMNLVTAIEAAAAKTIVARRSDVTSTYFETLNLFLLSIMNEIGPFAQTGLTFEIAGSG